jgi:type IV secretion system protein VirD4
MYQLARLLTAIGILLCFYCAVLIAVSTWPIGPGVLVFGVLYLMRSPRKPLTTLGSARWADEADLRRAGMLEADTGLILGRLDSGCTTSKRLGIRELFDWRAGAREACQRFWRGLHRGGNLVRLVNAVHVSVFAPTGEGKNVSLLVPTLLTVKDSLMAVDPKGDGAKLTAAYRRKKFGHRVVLLDPYKIVTETPDTFNPLDFIDKDDPHCLDRCRDLANALIVRQADEKDRHWNDAAEMWLTGLIATVVQYG